MSEKILQTLRWQAWERAKGELQAMLPTFWTEHGKDSKFEELDEKISIFIKDIEDNGLQE